jgi:hypothetical protein
MPGAMATTCVPVGQSTQTREAWTRGPQSWPPGPRRATGETDPQDELRRPAPY